MCSVYFVGGDFSRIRPGDCLVAFSRNTIFNLKGKIEQHKRSHCAVVYGGLPSGEGSNTVEQCYLIAADAFSDASKTGSTVQRSVVQSDGCFRCHWHGPQPVSTRQHILSSIHKPNVP